MLRNKSSSVNSNSSPSFDINKINSNVRVEFNKIINDMKHQLFFDPDLNHQHHMYILNNRHTIEDKFIQFLYDRINQLNIPSDLYEHLMRNLNEFSSYYKCIDIYSNINHRSDAH